MKCQQSPPGFADQRFDDAFAITAIAAQASGAT